MIYQADVFELLWGDYREMIGLAEPFYSNRIKSPAARPVLMTKLVEKPKINDSDEPAVHFFLMRTKPSAANCYPHTPNQVLLRKQNPMEKPMRACVIYHTRASVDP